MEKKTPSILLKTGDQLFEPLSRNNGEITKITQHPNGKLATVRWRIDGHPPHDTEHFYAKIIKSIKKGEIELVDPLRAD